MRLAIAGVLAIGVALTGCISVEPDDAAERAVAGAALGAGLGAGIGATFAINPLLGAVIGADSGAALGGAAGLMTTPPAPTYKPITPPAEAVIPGFYDSWAPGNYVPPPGTRAAPPRTG
jgi:pectin methylesterase-like acyl-CoA thioesterase